MIVLLGTGVRYLAKELCTNWPALFRRCRESELQREIIFQLGRSRYEKDNETRRTNETLLLNVRTYGVKALIIENLEYKELEYLGVCRKHKAWEGLLSPQWKVKHEKLIKWWLWWDPPDLIIARKLITWLESSWKLHHIPQDTCHVTCFGWFKITA